MMFLYTACYLILPSWTTVNLTKAETSLLDRFRQQLIIIRALFSMCNFLSHTLVLAVKLQSSVLFDVTHKRCLNSLRLKANEKVLNRLKAKRVGFCKGVSLNWH